MNFIVSDLTAKSGALLAKAREQLKVSDIEHPGVPDSIYLDDNPISLVFAGQYSAGKSSILKMLTGRSDIAVGGGITTQQVHSYDWNGITIVDTPGIHSKLRPDHDEISYEAITNSDMLVFVITNELFDSYLGQHFRKLAIDREKAGEMILVVNKMERGGNTPALQETIKNDLLKVTSPRTPDDLRICFVSAESYLDSLNEEDSEIAEALMCRSGYESLIKTLNDFVKERNISARLTTPLYKLDEILQTSIAKLQPSSGDADIDAIEEQYLQERHILSDTRRRIEQGVERIYINAVAEIRNEGINAANTIVYGAKEDEVNTQLEEAIRRVDSIAKKCGQDVEEELLSIVKDCERLLEELFKSEFSQKLKLRIKNRKDGFPPQIANFLKSDTLNQAGRFIANNALKEGASFGLKLGNFAGGNIHDAILKIGHFFGHKFKPWEAVKWARGIGVAGKVLAGLGIVFSVGMQIKEDVDAERIENEMRDNREKIRCGFNDVAHELESAFTTMLRNFIREQFDTPIQEIDGRVDEIRKLRADKSKNCVMLENTLKENRLLIREIHDLTYQL